METENHSQTSDWVNAKILRDRVSISLVHVGLIDGSTLDQRNLVSRNTIELKETLLIWWQCRIRLTPREIGHTVGTVWMGIFWKMKIKTSFFLKKKIPARWDSLLWKGPVLVTCTGLVWMRRSRQAKLLMHLYKINRPSGTLGLWNSKRIWKAMGKMASGNCKQVPWYPLGSLLNLQNERNLRSGLDSNIFSELKEDTAPDNLTWHFRKYSLNVSKNYTLILTLKILHTIYNIANWQSYLKRTWTSLLKDQNSRKAG
jgi:hypothetical protein